MHISAIRPTPLLSAIRPTPLQSFFFSIHSKQDYLFLGMRENQDFEEFCAELSDRFHRIIFKKDQVEISSEMIARLMAVVARGGELFIPLKDNSEAQALSLKIPGEWYPFAQERITTNDDELSTTVNPGLFMIIKKPGEPSASAPTLAPPLVYTPNGTR